MCPQCQKHTDGIVLLPMSFREIDEAQKTAADLPAKQNRGRKRKAQDEQAGGPYITDRRTGRWTNEEMAFCDKVIEQFEVGHLPVEDGSKLNEFLGNMLKSKQSRLTKKMKNAKLSTRLSKRTTGHLDAVDARIFSELEESFCNSIQDPQERAEIRFHMQKEWREQFSRVCAAVGQPLDADAWLTSVEEMDRRTSHAKNAARIAKRKLMMGVALRTDTRNPDHGVFIEKTEAEARAADADDDDLMLSFLADDKIAGVFDTAEKANLLHSGPFLSKVTNYLERHGVPFEHIDLWVPSYVPGEGSLENNCRLCYAGSATVGKLILPVGNNSRSLTKDEQFNFMAFGDYSQKFSFDVGCGLPGRVYESGRPCWEQSVHNAPHQHFERCGGAFQWGIKTVVGLPVASPNVGRIVATLYSSFDRAKDEELVARLSEEFTRVSWFLILILYWAFSSISRFTHSQPASVVSLQLLPSPKWKLVVDIGDEEEEASAQVHASTLATSHLSDVHHDADIKDSADFGLLANINAAAAHPSAPLSASEAKDIRDTRIDDVVALLGEHMPSDPTSPLATYIPGFMSLRLLLLRESHSTEEAELMKTMLDSYSSYTAGERDRAEIAAMLARDFIFLSQQDQTQQQLQSNGSHAFLGVGQGTVIGGSQLPNNTGLSLFGLPSTSSSLQNSPALTPIPAPGSIDALSIVSN